MLCVGGGGGRYKRFGVGTGIGVDACVPSSVSSLVRFGLID